MVALSLFEVVDPQDPAWSLAAELQKIEFERDVRASDNLGAARGAKSVTRQSLVDLLERPQAGLEFERFEENHDKSNARGDFGAAAGIAATMMRNAPQVSNTGGINSQSQEKCDDALLPPKEYLIKPFVSNYVQKKKAHWTDTDPELFAKLCQGGGGIDWLTATIYGHLNEHGKALVTSLKEVKRYMGKKDGVADRCAECGLNLQTMKYREQMIFVHPFRENKALQLSFGVAGKGRMYQPLIVHIDGICVTFGRLEDSDGPNGTRGPVATVQITGETFLRLGEVGAFNLAKDVCESLGIVTACMRASRIDMCVDLPGATVKSFLKPILGGDYICKAKQDVLIRMNPRKDKIGTIMFTSGAVKLRIYDKVAELVAKDPTGEKMALMEQNRWGGPQESAVRVEFEFHLGKNRAKKYNNFRELYEGMSDLIGWATNEWFRLCTVSGDRTHAGRYKGPESMCDEWLRTLHAFAFWSGRLDMRHIPPRVQSRPVDHIMKSAVGCFAAALGRAGLIPVDDITAWGILAQWMGPKTLSERCREKAIENMATHGVDMRNLTVRSTEDERQFQQLRSVNEWASQQQQGVSVSEGVGF
jgi:hypothetical protein